ncbi:alpha/beta fold hydrolase [Microbacterium sp. NPDC089320]|uniref:alpha/beta fold hydrolase n=1 Tax=Microbacterium sp. NPDC089320 TaxID=3155182 RepID=UPI0034357C4A
MTSDSGRPEIIVEHVTSPSATTRVTRVTTTAAAGREPFVLVAGIGVAASYFEFLAPTLAQRSDVYALDLAGFAGVAKPRGRTPSIAFFADQVEAVLDHYDLASPVLIGHSMGSQIVTEVLTRRTDLNHAVLVSPVVDEHEATVFRQAVRFLQSSLRESLHLAMIAVAAYILCGPVYFLRVLPHMLRYRITDAVGTLSTRMLFIRGEHDATSSRRFHSRLIAACPTASRWEIEGAAHSIINAHAVGVAKLTMRHLDDDLPTKGRMLDEEALTPPPVRTDLAMILGAVVARVREWVSALRGDEAGVAEAKEDHAQILWRAYRAGAWQDRG